MLSCLKDGWRSWFVLISPLAMLTMVHSREEGGEGGAGDASACRNIFAHLPRMIYFVPNYMYEEAGLGRSREGLGGARTRYIYMLLIIPSEVD